jgi:transposase-like protein
MATTDSAVVAAAKELTDKIRIAADDLWELIAAAYQSKAWEALGYKNWDAYVTKELGELKIRIPKEDRREIVGTLRDAGLSLRAIAAATGYDKHTVTRDLQESRPHLVPAPKQRTKTCPPKTRQPEAGVKRAISVVAKVTTELASLDFDRELAGLREQALSDLQRAREALNTVITKLESLIS